MLMWVIEINTWTYTLLCSKQIKAKHFHVERQNMCCFIIYSHLEKFLSISSTVFMETDIQRRFYVTRFIKSRIVMWWFWLDEFYTSARMRILIAVAYVMKLKWFNTKIKFYFRGSFSLLYLATIFMKELKKFVDECNYLWCFCENNF